MKPPHVRVADNGDAELRIWDSPTRITYWPSILRKDPCSYCGKPRSGTVDHIEPRGRGGLNRVENMGGACPSCNGSKKDQDMLWFMLKRAGYQPVTRRQRRESKKQRRQRIADNRRERKMQEVRERAVSNLKVIRQEAPYKAPPYGTARSYR